MFGLTNNTSHGGSRLGAHSGHVEGYMSADPSGMAMSIQPGSFKNSIARLAVAAAQAVVIYQQVQLARDYYNTNKQDYDFWRATYRDPMQDLRTDVYAESRMYFDRINTPTCYKQSGVAMSRTVDAKWQDSMRRTNRYATGHHIALTQDFALMRHNAQASGYNTASVIARHKLDTYDERRHMRRLAILNIGIAAGNTAKAGLASAVGTVINGQNQLGSAIGAFGNGLSRFSGYSAGREDTASRMRK